LHAPGLIACTQPVDMHVTWACRSRTSLCCALALCSARETWARLASWLVLCAAPCRAMRVSRRLCATLDCVLAARAQFSCRGSGCCAGLQRRPVLRAAWLACRQCTPARCGVRLLPQTTAATAQGLWAVRSWRAVAAACWQAAMRARVSRGGACHVAARVTWRRVSRGGACVGALGAACATLLGRSGCCAAACCLVPAEPWGHVTGRGTSSAACVLRVWRVCVVCCAARVSCGRWKPALASTHRTHL
jgi:hypothetical protein